MKKSLSKYLLLLAFAGSTVLAPSCKKDFGEINTDPSVVVNPDIKFLLTYSEDRLASYMGGEYVWETMEQFWRFTQHITSDPYEVTGNVNSRYSAFYTSILPNLVEIRRQIDLKADKDLYQKEAAVTYILQILQGIKVTDMNGSIPYTEAIQGRYDAKYNPVYDTQEALFNTWITELNSAITTLSAAGADQQSYGTADFYYKSDWVKWIKLANTLKLRIAVRWENQDAAKTKEIFQQVMTDATGPIDTDDAQLSYVNKNYNGTGNDINYRSIRYATESIIGFMKSSNDPRIGIYFSANDLTPAFKDSVTKYSVTPPAFIDVNDPLIMYQGGPADWTTDPARAAYLSNAFPVGPSAKYFLISTINRWFMAPKWNRNNNADALYTELLVSNAESCLTVAELIQKGYGSGVNTKGTAEDWYKKGIASSILTMNNIAKTAISTTAFTDDGSSLINAYLDDAQVKFDGTNDLERIYIQEYLNFFRNMNEAFVLCRRTGYPKYNSTYYAREPFNEVIPRRWWLTDPGEVNRVNWSAAMSDQGFTPNAQDVPTLNSQRVWYDKNAPDFGEGQ
ncbi:MAG: SusD/RagB family nutrient-binding outer membrane lipoprotein [Bacteroidota bacterium]